MPGIQENATNDVVRIIESREIARNATPFQMSSVSVISSYKQGKQPRPPSTAQKTVPCPECRKPFLRFRERPGGSLNKNAYKVCIDCWRSSKKRLKETEKLHAIELEENDQVFQISAIDTPGLTSVLDSQTKTITPWSQSRQSLILAPCPTCGPQRLREGRLYDQRTSTVSLCHKKGHILDTCGQFHAIIKGRSQDEDIVTNTVIYVSKSLNGFFSVQANYD